MDESPRHFDFFERMERRYGSVGPEFKKKEVAGYCRVFFRGSKSVADIRAMHAAGGWDRAENDAIVYADAAVSLDANAGCVESCEVDWSKN
jgi:hypothetical protein